MKKIYSLLIIVFAISSTLSAQKIKLPVPVTPGSLVTTQTNTSTIPPTTLYPNGFIKDRCGFVTQMNNLKAAGYDQVAFEEFINQKIASMKAAKVAVTNYIIPVIFHVIHDGTAEGTGANIIASQIYQQIDQLNKDFGNLSGSPFPAAANTGLSFCPVLRDPLGNVLAQPGIERINRVTKGWTDPTTFTSAQVNTMISYINSTIKPASIWDPTQYVNIWVYNFSNSGLLGYATFPTAGLADLPPGETATTAGVVFLSGSIGSVSSPGTATPYALGRTVTHELGHFFGLYHVWGDVATCGGTDYCADTPPCSDDYYSSVPVCVAPVQCSGQTRMIQDYMDYSDDGCMNTFTQNQVDRIQAVMAAAPRRPRNPSATICTPTIANALRFVNDATTTAETGTGATCPKFKDYLITVAPAIAASGNATVNFTFTGTATQNVDYTIVGAASVSYVNGESGAKGVTIRVSDDAEVEPSETIIVNFTITGAGLVAGTVNQTHTITITNDDQLNFINNTNLVTTLLSEDFTTGTGGNIPTGWFKGSFIGPAGTNVWTVNPVYGAATGFTAGTNGRVLHITNALAAAQTNETAVNAYTISSTSDAAVITKAITTTGYQNIKLTFDYACNGEADVDGVYDFGLLRYSTTAQTSGLLPITDVNGDVIVLQGTTAKTTVTVSLPADAGNVPNLWIGFEWRNDDNIGTNPPFIIDNIIVTGENSGVETILNQTVTQTHNQVQTEQYMSAANKIIAAISNPNMNIGCNTATIQNSGGGQTNVTTNTGVYKRSNKIIKITPAVANATATYQVTLYYTTGELTVWGAEVPLLKILKVKDGVNVTTTTLDGTNAQVFTATVDDQRAIKGYASFTANVTGGFSQFMLTSQLTVIPVSLLSFEARGNGKNILLNWSTATEINNKGFVIERSLNGIDFETIGWENGKLNSNQITNYRYIDNFVQPNVIYHYRLRQTDINNNQKLSEIRQAKIKSSEIEVSLSPNPAKDQLKLFVSGATGLADLRLINSIGQQVRSWNQINVSTAPALLDIRGLASGMYMLQVITTGSNTVEKLIIK